MITTNNKISYFGCFGFNFIWKYPLFVNWSLNRAQICYLYLDKQNELFKEGKAIFDEELHEWSDDPDFGGGLNLDTQFYSRNFGLLLQPEKRWNTAQELEDLEEFYNSIDRVALPASFDARKFGIIILILFKNIKTPRPSLIVCDPLRGF